MKAKFAAIKEAALKDGWTIDRTSGGRLRFTHPAVEIPIFTSALPGEFRSLRNLEATLQRALRRNVPESEPFTEPVADTRIKKKKKPRVAPLDTIRPVRPEPLPEPPAEILKGWAALGSLQNRYAKSSAWRYAVLRMRVIAGREWRDIINLRQKYKTDPVYQRELVTAWTNSTKFGTDDEVRNLRERLRMKGRVALAVEQFRRITVAFEEADVDPRNSYRHHVRFGRPIRKPA